MKNKIKLIALGLVVFSLFAFYLGFNARQPRITYALPPDFFLMLTVKDEDFSFIKSPLKIKYEAKDNIGELVLKDNPSFEYYINSVCPFGSDLYCKDFWITRIIDSDDNIREISSIKLENIEQNNAFDLNKQRDNSIEVIVKDIGIPVDPEVKTKKFPMSIDVDIDEGTETPEEVIVLIDSKAAEAVEKTVKKEEYKTGEFEITAAEEFSPDYKVQISTYKDSGKAAACTVAKTSTGSSVGSGKATVDLHYDGETELKDDKNDLNITIDCDHPVAPPASLGSGSGASGSGGAGAGYQCPAGSENAGACFCDDNMFTKMEKVEWPTTNKFGMHTLINYGFCEFGVEVQRACQMIGHNDTNGTNPGYIKQYIYGINGVTLPHITSCSNETDHATVGKFAFDFLKTVWYDKHIPVIRIGDQPGGNNFGTKTSDAVGFINSMAGHNLRKGSPLIVEIFNEPNIASEWSGTPQQYAFRLAATYAKAKTDENLKITNAGLSPNGKPAEFIWKMYQGFEAAESADGSLVQENGLPHLFLYAFDFWGSQGKLASAGSTSYDCSLSYTTSFNTTDGKTTLVGTLPEAKEDIAQHQRELCLINTLLKADQELFAHPNRFYIPQKMEDILTNGDVDPKLVSPAFLNPASCAAHDLYIAKKYTTPCVTYEKYIKGLGLNWRSASNPGLQAFLMEAGSSGQGQGRIDTITAAMKAWDDDASVKGYVFWEVMDATGVWSQWDWFSPPNGDETELSEAIKKYRNITEEKITCCSTPTKNEACQAADADKQVVDGENAIPPDTGTPGEPAADPDCDPAVEKCDASLFTPLPVAQPAPFFDWLVPTAQADSTPWYLQPFESAVLVPFSKSYPGFPDGHRGMVVFDAPEKNLEISEASLDILHTSALAQAPASEAGLLGSSLDVDGDSLFASLIPRAYADAMYEPQTGVNADGQIMLQPDNLSEATVYEYRATSSPFDSLSFDYAYQTPTGSGQPIELKVILSNGQDTQLAFSPEQALSPGTNWTAADENSGTSDLGFDESGKISLEQFKSQPLYIRFVVSFAAGANPDLSDPDYFEGIQLRHIMLEGTDISTTIGYGYTGESRHVVSAWDDGVIRAYASSDPFDPTTPEFAAIYVWSHPYRKWISSDGSLYKGEVRRLPDAVELCNGTRYNVTSITPSTESTGTLIDLDFGDILEQSGAPPKSVLDYITFEYGSDCGDGGYNSKITLYALVEDEDGNIIEGSSQRIWDRIVNAGWESVHLDLSDYKDERLALRMIVENVNAEHFQPVYIAGMRVAYEDYITSFVSNSLISSSLLTIIVGSIMLLILAALAVLVLRRSIAKKAGS